MVELVGGLKQRKKIEAVPLSNDTIYFRISDMLTNILEHIIGELGNWNSFSFSIQLDESTEISQYNQLLVFVCNIFAETSKEELLFFNHF